MADTNSDPGIEKNAGAKRAWALFVGLPLIILIAAVAFSGGKERASQAGSGQESDGKTSAEQPSRVERELGHPALGEAGAPVVMIEYGDYQ